MTSSAGRQRTPKAYEFRCNFGAPSSSRHFSSKWVAQQQQEEEQEDGVSLARAHLICQGDARRSGLFCSSSHHQRHEMACQVESGAMASERSTHEVLDRKIEPGGKICSSSYRSWRPSDALL